MVRFEPLVVITNFELVEVGTLYHSLSGRQVYFFKLHRLIEISPTSGRERKTSTTTYLPLIGHKNLLG